MSTLGCLLLNVKASACLLYWRRSWLFPQIDAALHHGGAGTTGASLRGEIIQYALQRRPFIEVSAGIPTLIRPWFG